MRESSRTWIAALGDETLYEVDLPSCCGRTASGEEESFECPSCGAMWQEPLPAFVEEDAFMDRSSDRRERRGAA